MTAESDVYCTRPCFLLGEKGPFALFKLPTLWLRTYLFKMKSYLLEVYIKFSPNSVYIYTVEFTLTLTLEAIRVSDRFCQMKCPLVKSTKNFKVLSKSFKNQSLD